MKGLKKRISWLLIISMILGQASFASLADSDDDDEYDDTEIVLINDLFGGGAGSSGRNRPYGGGVPEYKDVKWDDLASPSVTTEEDKNNVVYYANGESITIVASGSNTYIVEDNGAYTRVVNDVDDGKNSYVYGGATSSDASFRKTDITVQGGRVNSINGGNRNEGNLDDVKITINAGTVGVVYANASGKSTGVIGDFGGAATYADRKKNRTVKHAGITVNGGTVNSLLTGNGGYTYTEDLEITVNGGTIGAEYADDPMGLLVGGANGEVGKAVLNMNGGTVCAVSTGQRAYVGKAVYNLNAGTVGEIYAGTWYPSSEAFSNYEDGKGYGSFHYGKADKMEINVEAGMKYNGVYAGFHLLDSEQSKALEWLSKGGYGFVKDNYYKDGDKPTVAISVGASPLKDADVSEWLESSDLINNGFNPEKEYNEFVTLNLPKLTAENASIQVAADAVAKGTDTEMSILPGTDITIRADAAKEDYKFGGWEVSGADLKDDFSGKEAEVNFEMPQGMSDIALKALYEEKGLTLDTESLDLDLYENSEAMDWADIMIESSDYATPSVASYDESILDIAAMNDADSGEIIGWTVNAHKTGETIIKFTAEDSGRILAEVPVTVVDTTPELTVIGGKVAVVDGRPAAGETFGKYPEGADIVLSPENLPDKVFTGWKVTGSSGVEVDEENLLVMPDSSITVTAQYRDKVFQFASGTKEEISLNLDQTETNTDKTPDTYTFLLETDYAGDRIAVSSANDKYAAVTTNGDGSYTVKAAGAGMTAIQAKLTKDDGSVIVKEIAVNVADTTKKTEASNGAADINTDNAEVEAPEIPEGIDQEQAEQLQAEAETKVKEALKSIAKNEAATAGVSGFDAVSESVLEAAGIPAGANVVIYPKQELKKVETAFEETRTIDPVTKEEVVTYAPVVKKIVFDIKPYAASNSGSDTEKLVNGLKGNFRFRIPVPSAISASAKYAKLTHKSDQGGVVAGDQYLTIQEENGQKFVNVTANHFSIFELEFTESKPSSGRTGGGGGGGGGSKTTASTGRWVLNATGWWYQYADNTYPANGWAYLGYAANGNKWYHFDANGYMQTGWFTDVDGHKYYLHPISDGTRGYMYTGWHEIDGKWYYFATAKTETNPAGALWVSAMTPDGYQVGADGARIQ